VLSSSSLVILHYGCKWIWLTVGESSGLLCNTAQGGNFGAFVGVYEDVRDTYIASVNPLTP
jgi:hypothetical protein